MKTNFIKTTEEGKTLVEVFGGEEVLQNTLNKFREIGLNSNSFKEIAIAYKEKLTKEELTTVAVSVLTNMDFIKQLALNVASTNIEEGEEFEFNPIGDEDTSLKDSLGDKNIKIVLKKINEILHETDGNIGKTAERIYESMSVEEIIYSILFLL